MNSIRFLYSVGWDPGPPLSNRSYMVKGSHITKNYVVRVFTPCSNPAFPLGKKKQNRFHNLVCPVRMGQTGAETQV